MLLLDFTAFSTFFKKDLTDVSSFQEESVYQRGTMISMGYARSIFSCQSFSETGKNSRGGYELESSDMNARALRSVAA